jgi:hypothetical protein
LCGCGARENRKGGRQHSQKAHSAAPTKRANTA